MQKWTPQGLACCYLVKVQEGMTFTTALVPPLLLTPTLVLSVYWAHF